MIGLPMAPTAAFPADAKAAIFTQHSLRDPQLAAKLLARIRAGKEVFMSWPLLQDLRASELGRVMNVIGDRGTATSSSFRVRGAFWDTEPVAAGRPFTFPKIQLSTWPYVRSVALIREDADFGVLLSTPYMEGTVDVLNLPDNSYDLLRLPEPVLNAVRRVFFEELGVRLVGMGGVALYPFGERQYVLYNMNDTVAKVALHLPADAPLGGWRERMNGDTLVVTRTEEGREQWKQVGTEVALSLKPFEVALVER